MLAHTLQIRLSTGAGQTGCIDEGVGAAVGALTVRVLLRPLARGLLAALPQAWLALGPTLYCATCTQQYSSLGGIL